MKPFDRPPVLHRSGAFVLRVTHPVSAMSRGARGARLAHWARGAKKQ